MSERVTDSILLEIATHGKEPYERAMAEELIERRAAEQVDHEHEWLETYRMAWVTCFASEPTIQDTHDAATYTANLVHGERTR